MVSASLKNHRIAPRKVRLVADMIRGKGVAEAALILDHAIKKAHTPLRSLLDSAIANATNNFQLDKATLYIKEIRVGQGYTLKRFMPVSRGSAHPIKKRTSHVTLVLAPREEKAKKVAPKSKTKSK